MSIGGVRLSVDPARHVRTGLAWSAMAGRLARDLPCYSRQTLSPAAIHAAIRQRLRSRAERFLWLAEHAIYRVPGSPYRRLLQAVGCEPGDLRSLVHAEGLEGALSRLLRDGVYLSFQEAKGEAEIVRGSLRFTPRAADFQNPLFAPHFPIRTGGSRSRGTTVGISLQFIADLAVNYGVGRDAHGVFETDQAVWMTTPLRELLVNVKLGRPSLAWFHPHKELPLPVRAASGYLRGLARVSGVQIPRPEWQRLHDPRPLLDWLLLQGGHRRVTMTTPSGGAVRLAGLALEAGARLDHVTFIMRGEPFTAAKLKVVRESGAGAISCYGFVEAGGGLARGCVEPEAVDDVHLFTDRIALVTRPHAVSPIGPFVDSLHFTSVLASSPRILLNAEVGDHATVERRRCGCLLGSLGLDTHLRDIASHEKMTGEGVTFVRSTLTRVLEEELPAQFGGSPVDYQLVEMEDDGGLTRVVLRADPKLGPIDETALREAFLGALGRGDGLQAHMARVWTEAETLAVRREAPLVTAAGKVLPLHRERRASLVG